MCRHMQTYTNQKHKVADISGKPAVRVNNAIPHVCVRTRVYRDVYVAPTHPQLPTVTTTVVLQLWYRVKKPVLEDLVVIQSDMPVPRLCGPFSLQPQQTHTHTFTYTGYNDSKLHGPVCGLNTPGGQDARKSESNRKHSTVS